MADDVVRVSILADVANAVGGFAKAAAGAAAAYVSFKKLVQISKESVDAFMESEDAEARLAAAIRITGQESTSSVRSMAAYARQLQNVTNYEDEASMAAMGLLMQLGGLTEEGVRKTLPLLQDFATTFDMDLTQAAELFGKTIGSSTNALSRYGIEIEKGLSPQEKLKTVLEQLDSKMGGFAETMAQTTRGQLQSMKIMVGELKEAWGGLLASIMNTDVAKTATTHLTLEMQRLAWIVKEGKLLAEDTAGYSKQQLIEYNAELSEGVKLYKALMDERNNKSDSDPFWKRYREDLEEVQRRMAVVGQEIGKIQQTEGDTTGGTKALTIATGDLGDSAEETAKQLERELKAIEDLRGVMYSGPIDPMARQLGLPPTETSPWQPSIPSIEPFWEDPAAVATQAASDAYAKIAETFSEWEHVSASLAKINEVTMADMVDGQMAVAEAAKKAAEDTREAWSNTLTSIDEIVGRLGALSDQYYRNQESRLDNEYESRKKTIESTITDEAKKADALASLDEEFETRRKKIAHDQAVSEKALGIFNTLIDTAQAIMKAMATLPPPGNFVMAGIVGAMGAAQTALIAAQPIPALARGGEFDVPPGFPADSYPMRVSSGEHVAVTPAGGGGGQQIIINLDGRAIADFVTRGTRDRRIIVDARSIA